jgi:hypothetical protein
VKERREESKEGEGINNKNYISARATVKDTTSTPPLGPPSIQTRFSWEDEWSFLPSYEIVEVNGHVE